MRVPDCKLSNKSMIPSHSILLRNMFLIIKLFVFRRFEKQDWTRNAFYLIIEKNTGIHKYVYPSDHKKTVFNYLFHFNIIIFTSKQSNCLIYIWSHFNFGINNIKIIVINKHNMKFPHFKHLHTL